MLRISQLKLPVEHTKEQLRKKLIKTVRIREDELLDFQIRKQRLSGKERKGDSQTDEEQSTADRSTTIPHP